MRDALSIFDRVVSFSGTSLTRQAVTENLNVLDYETYFKSTDHILENKIPELLIQFNETLAKGFDGHHYIAGLASHFRDLMVCKTPETIELLEVGEQTREKYLKQSQQTSYEFLLKAIQLANDCDLKYKSSKNQRLLVELCLMQLASINFEGEKKNHKRFIIPASYFKARGIEPVKVDPEKLKKKPEEAQAGLENEIPDTPAEPEPVAAETAVAQKLTEKRPQIILNRQQKVTSGLSLSSIKKKKEHQIRQMEVILDEEDLPKDPFTEDDMLASWNDYVAVIEKKGQFNLASILRIDTPRLQDNTIHLEFPNATNKVELERQKTDLLRHLRTSLNNFDIGLSIVVNEEMEKQYAYTPKEKYDKLKEKNPDIDLLRKTFDLDI